MGWSAMGDCVLSWSYSLTIFTMIKCPFLFALCVRSLCDTQIFTLIIDQTINVCVCIKLTRRCTGWSAHLMCALKYHAFSNGLHNGLYTRLPNGQMLNRWLSDKNNASVIQLRFRGAKKVN